MSNEKHGAGKNALPPSSGSENGSVKYGCVIKLITPITTYRASTWMATIDEKREPEFAEKIRSLPVGGKWKNWWKHPDNIMRLFPPNAEHTDEAYRHENRKKTND